MICILLSNFLMFQVIFCTVMGAVAGPRMELRMPVPTVKFVERICYIPLEGFVLPLVFNLILALLAAMFGFLTRKLPENFNESWYIFVSVSTTIFLWAVFLPTYFTTFYSTSRSALLGFCLIVNAYITLFCLYLPKLYAVYFLAENQIIINSATKGSINIHPATDNKSEKEIYATKSSLAQ